MTPAESFEAGYVDGVNHAQSRADADEAYSRGYLLGVQDRRKRLNEFKAQG